MHELVSDLINVALNDIYFPIELLFRLLDLKIFQKTKDPILVLLLKTNPYFFSKVAYFWLK